MQNLFCKFNMSKKFISFFLAALLSISSVSAFAETSNSVDNSDTTGTTIEVPTEESTDTAGELATDAPLETVTETPENDTDEDTTEISTETPSENPTEEPDVSISTDDDIDVTVNGTILTKDVDYVLSYKDNVQVGTATVTITFIGNYSGMLEQQFNIVKKTTSSSGGSRGGGGSTITSNYIVTVTDKDGKTISVTKTEKDGEITLTLPSNTLLDEDSSYTVLVKDKTGTVSADTTVTLKDKNGASATGTTNSDGIITFPITEVTEFEHHIAYINGYEDGTFRPDANITRAETAAMLYRVLSLDSDNVNSSNYTDINRDAWYADSVIGLSNAGIIDGYEDGTFRPENNITRAELVAMVTRSTTVEKYKDIPFSDVSSDMWSADYIYTAYTNGIIDGYEDGTFRPNNSITRAEVVKIINGILGRNDLQTGDNPFSDVSASHWAYSNILEAAIEHDMAVNSEAETDSANETEAAH